MGKKGECKIAFLGIIMLYKNFHYVILGGRRNYSMELFKKDKSSEEYYKYKEAREKFTEENLEMKITLNQKVSDPKNIQ